MALLYDSTLEFPVQWSTQQLPSSDKKKRPSAWAEFYEEDDKLACTERWAPRKLGGGNHQGSQGTPCKYRLGFQVWGCMVEVLGIVVYGAGLLIFASLTGTRR